MDFIRTFIEQKITAAIGLPVKMGSLSVAPLAGTVEIRDLAVDGLLKVARISATISYARALKQELVIKSLTVESPTITLQPPFPRKPAPPPTPSDKKPAASKSSAWSFEASNVLVTNGSITVTKDDFTFAIDRLDGTIKRTSAEAFEIAVQSATSGRRHPDVELGPAKITGTLAGEALDLQLKVGTIVDARVRSTAVKRGRWSGTLEVMTDATTLMRLSPKPLPITAASGEVTLSAAAEVSVDRKIRIERFAINVRNAQIDAALI